MSTVSDPHPYFSWYEAADIYGIQITTHDSRRAVHTEGGTPDLLTLKDLCMEDMESFDTDGRYKVYAIDENGKRKPMPMPLRVADMHGDIHGPDVAGVAVLDDELGGNGGARNVEHHTVRAWMRELREQREELQEGMRAIEDARAELEQERRLFETETGDKMLTFMQLQLQAEQQRARLELSKMETERERIRSEREREEKEHHARLKREEEAHALRLKREEDRIAQQEKERKEREDRYETLRETARIREMELQTELTRSSHSIERMKLEQRLQTKISQIERDSGMELSPEIRDRLALEEWEAEKEDRAAARTSSPLDKLIPLGERIIEALQQASAERALAERRGARSRARQPPPSPIDSGEDPFEDPGLGGDDERTNPVADPRELRGDGDDGERRGPPGWTPEPSGPDSGELGDI